MNEQRTQLEDLSVELFHLIFKYLAPHELFQAFNHLNNRLTAILAQQPLCLPNNRQMPVDLYLEYISKISGDYASRIVYVHLSERYAPHAVNDLLAKECEYPFTLPALKAATIEDLPPNIFLRLIEGSSLLTKVQLLTVDMYHNSYHYPDYGHTPDIDYILPLLNNLPNLCSLTLCISPLFTDGYIDEMKSFIPFIAPHPKLHTLSIDECSRHLFAELLDHGLLPKLRRLDVIFSRAEFLDFKTNRRSWVPTSPAVTFKQSCMPELRRVRVYLHDDVAGMLTYFDDIHRHGQLEKLEINGYVDVSSNGNLPRLSDLRKWLTMSRSSKFTFEMNLSLASTDGEHSTALLTEYRRATGKTRTKSYSKVNIRYPRMTLLHPVDSSDEDSSDEPMEEDVTYPIHNYINKLEIIKENCVEATWVEEMNGISCWPCLRKITLRGDCMGDRNTVNVVISLLLHIVQCSPRCCELIIDAADGFDSNFERHGQVEFHFGHLLETNAQLGIILASQLEVLRFNGEHVNCSLLDLAQTFDRLFSHSTSPPVLKSLTFDVGAHPRAWLNIYHLFRGTQLLFNRFPSLIHFTLNCKPYDAYEGTIYDFSELAEEWYAQWRMSESKQNRFRALSFRHRPNSLDVWL